MSDKAPVSDEQQASAEIEPSSITEDEAQTEGEPEDSELSTRPMTEIQKILAISSGMETAEELFEFIETGDIEETLLTRESVLNKKVKLEKGRITAEESIVYIENLDAVLVMFRDVTREEKIREQHYNLKVETVEMARKVIEKQMMVAQEIAGLLGETTAETKVTLTKLRDSILNEED